MKVYTIVRKSDPLTPIVWRNYAKPVPVYCDRLGAEDLCEAFLKYWPHKYTDIMVVECELTIKPEHLKATAE